MEQSALEAMQACQATHWWYKARRRILANIIATLPLPPHAHILEAGCGPGVNLPMLKRFGQVHAFDISPYCVAAACAQGFAATLGHLPDGLPALPAMDLVGAFDVIEHVADDQAALKSLYAALKPGGYFIATVPAYGWLWSEHDVRNHHFRRYTRPHFKRVIEQAGFEVLRMSYFNSHLFPLIAAIRGVRTLLGLRGFQDERVPPRALNALLETIFASEVYGLRAFDYPFGVSLLVTAHKKPTMMLC
jgi:SAM-dependent methyltransferase